MRDEGQEGDGEEDDDDQDEGRPGQHGSEGLVSPSPVELPSSH